MRVNQLKINGFTKILTKILFLNVICGSSPGNIYKIYGGHKSLNDHPTAQNNRVQILFLPEVKADLDCFLENDFSLRHSKILPYKINYNDGFVSSEQTNVIIKHIKFCSSLPRYPPISVM